MCSLFVQNKVNGFLGDKFLHGDFSNNCTGNGKSMAVTDRTYVLLFIGKGGGNSSHWSCDNLDV